MSSKTICDWCGEDIEKDQESSVVEICITGAFDVKKKLDLHGKGDKSDCTKKYEKAIMSIINEEPSKYR